MDELKPCPCHFCGAPSYRPTWHRTLWSFDHKDGCFMKGTPVFDDDVAAWNARAPSVPEGWRDIASAPKSTHVGSRVSGIYVLGYCPDEGVSPESCINVVWWEPLLDGGVWTDGHCTVRPTMWMPLPAAPKVPA